MPEVFTDYVRALKNNEAGNDVLILSHLKTALTNQLKAIGQWNLSPSYLGFQGSSWRDPDAMDDLIQEAYQKCIFENLDNLFNMVTQNGTCEGAVRQKIEWFLQSHHTGGNRASKQVFKNLRSAIQSLTAQGIVARERDGKEFRSKNIVLKSGASSPATDQQLKDYFADKIGIQEFATRLSKDSPDSVQLFEKILRDAFDNGLSGFYAGELANLFSEALTIQLFGSSQMDDSNEDLTSFLDSIPDPRTLANPEHYLNLGPGTGNDPYASMREIVQVHVPEITLHDRILKMIDVMETLSCDQTVPKITVRLLADRLKKGKSTVQDDLDRLKHACQLAKAKEAAE